MSKEAFVRETRMNQDEAEAFIKNFYQTFPTMTQYLDDIKRRIYEMGYVQSIYGRTLYFDSSRMISNAILKVQVVGTKFYSMKTKEGSSYFFLIRRSDKQ